MAWADDRRDERRGDRRGEGLGGKPARFPVCAALFRQFEFRAGNAGLPAQRRALRPGLSLCRGRLWRHADPLCLHPRGRGLSRAQPLGPGRYVSPPLRAHGKAGGAAARLRKAAGADQDAGRRSRQMRREDLADPVHKTARRAPHVSERRRLPVSRSGLRFLARHRGRGGDRQGKRVSHLPGLDLQLAPLRGRRLRHLAGHRGADHRARGECRAPLGASCAAAGHRSGDRLEGEARLCAGAQSRRELSRPDRRQWPAADRADLDRPEPDLCLQLRGKAGPRKSAT